MRPWSLNHKLHFPKQHELLETAQDTTGSAIIKKLNYDTAREIAFPP